MRKLGSRIAATSAGLLTLLGLSAGSAHGDRIIETVYAQPVSYYVPTGYVTTSRSLLANETLYSPTSYAYVAPTTYAYAAPTSYSYVAPTSYAYVAPTSYSYVVPTTTSYVWPSTYRTTAYTALPTSYAVTPTVYQTTVYRRPGLLRRLAARPVIETTRSYSYDLYPTTYFQPTTIAYEAPVVTTSLVGCEEAIVPFNPPAPAAPANGAGNADATTKSVISKPRDSGEPSLDYPTKSAAKAAPKEASSPVTPVAPDKDGAGSLTEPGSELPKPSGSGTQERSSFRPTYNKTMEARAGAPSLPVLRGLVSSVDGKPKPNLEVVFTDLKGTYPDKVKKTDATGTFEIFLPNGGWSVRVVDPSTPGAKAMNYLENVTSTGGRYLDDAGMPIDGLRLTH